ncbi:AMIN-like domain-containing (lipo)protein [Haloactinomyces albus]|uniref:AMIN-like domain-containing (lipo)protein n=1 Tax=Haloactinomyces albus TaxID=1352928 RepID=UPI004042F981
MQSSHAVTQPSTAQVSATQAQPSTTQPSTTQASTTQAQPSTTQQQAAQESTRVKPSTGAKQQPAAQQPPAQNPATLTGIEVKPGDASYDRVIFNFSGTQGGQRLPEHTPTYLEDYPRKPGSGKPVEMEGQLFLKMSFSPATASGSVRESVEATLPTVAEVRYLGGFEKVQEAAIGVNSCHGAPVRAPFEVTTRDSAIVVDVGTPNCGSDDPVTRECGDVSFEPQTDYGAFNITATNVGCEKARNVASLVEGRIGQPYGTPGGFSCLPEYDDSEPTPNYVYTCTRADAKVTFITG